MHESKHLCVSSSLSAECAAWSGNMCLYTGAVAVSTSPAGDAGQHRGYERGESLHEGEREREREREGWRGGEQVVIRKAEGQKEK